MYWYALFVFDGKEEEVVEQLKTLDSEEYFYPFVPKIATIFKSKHKTVREYHTMFPGYVFIETEKSPEQTYKTLGEYFRSSSLIIKVLRYGNEYEIALCQRDSEILNRLLNSEKCLEMSTGIIEGDKVFIENGPLIGLESTIKKIDRHKSTAVIEFDCMGCTQRLKVGLDIVKKI